MSRPRRRPHGVSLELKPADPFELVRWLARSQSDPRKAVAELVQNSLDAGARHVTVRRMRVKGELCLLVRDDGEGVLPDLPREEALRYVATHVGHSRKMGLDPAERARRVVAGKYGVGLLGFWSIGRFFELRSRVAGSEVFALHLEEDSPHAQILPMTRLIDAPETFAEALVVGVHETAQKVLGGRRLADYLASELRGQLLAHEREGAPGAGGHRAELVVHDDVARGLAQKTFVVTPRRFSGERLALPPEIEAPGFAPVRVELYLARGAEQPQIQVACSGTLVSDDIGGLDALGLAEPPWVGRELCGILDFPSFNVPPGTRRGVMPDKAAEAFVAALEKLAPLVLGELERLDADRDVVRDLRRALRGFQRRLPRYALPDVARSAAGDLGGHAGGAGTAATGAGSAAGDLGGAGADAADLPPGAALPEPHAPPRAPEGEDMHLFPPGPLARVRVVPEHGRIAPGGERRLQATGVDDSGRPLSDVAFRWSIDATAGMPLLALRGEGPRVVACARPDAAIGDEARVTVVATQGDRRATAAATLDVVSDAGAEASLGIPEPQLVSDVDGAWRSRMTGSLWEVNAEHEDYRALRGDPRSRMRYLLALFAKEIVLRTTGRPETADALESVVEVLAHAERNLRGA